MLFLLNDVVFDLDEACPVTPADTRRFEKLSFDYVLELGCELFAEDPMLHRNDPQRARRLAWLIAERSPDVNAALFAALLEGASVRPRWGRHPRLSIWGPLEARLQRAARPSLKELLLTDDARADLVLPARGKARRRPVAVPD